MKNNETITAHLSNKLGEEITLTAQEGRTYTKRVRRGHGEGKHTEWIKKQVYKNERGLLYIVNEDEHGVRVATKVSYRDC